MWWVRLTAQELLDGIHNVQSWYYAFQIPLFDQDDSWLLAGKRGKKDNNVEIKERKG